MPRTPRGITLAAVVKIFVAVTDRSWFDGLAAAVPDEVNFWQHSGRINFRALAPGELFLFKLHVPLDHIVGRLVFMGTSARGARRWYAPPERSAVTNALLGKWERGA